MLPALKNKTILFQLLILLKYVEFYVVKISKENMKNFQRYGELNPKDVNVFTFSLKSRVGQRFQPLRKKGDTNLVTSKLVF